MKATKKQYDLFKKEVLKLLEDFNLGGWEIHFELDQKDKENLSGLRWDRKGRQATFILNEDWRDNELNDKQIKKSALHEVLHLTMARLISFSKDRFVQASEIEEASEESVVLLVDYLTK